MPVAHLVAHDHSSTRLKMLRRCAPAENSPRERERSTLAWICEREQNPRLDNRVASLLCEREYFAPVDKEPPVLSPRSPRTHALCVHRVLPVARARTLPVVISLSLPPSRTSLSSAQPRSFACLVPSSSRSHEPLSALSVPRSPRSVDHPPLLLLFVVRPAALSLSLSFARDPDSGFSWQLTVARDARLSLSLSVSPLCFHQFLVHKPLSDLFLALPANPPLFSPLLYTSRWHEVVCVKSRVCRSEQTDRDPRFVALRVSRKGGN